MNVTFLGTGTSQGIPVIGCKCEVCKSLDFKDKRFRTSIYVEVSGIHLIVDTGPDFRMQSLNNRIEQLDAVLYTHEHKDHTAGMDDIRSFNFLLKKDIPVYGRQQVLDTLKREFAYAFSENKYPGVPNINQVEVRNEPFQINEISILPIEGWHKDLPVFGYRIKDFAYLTDVNYVSEEEQQKLNGCDTLVVNALHRNKHYSHFNLEEALAFIDRVNPKKAYLTHISHQMGRHKDVEKELPDHIRIAYDGLKLTL